MGKATVISDQGEGLYTIHVNMDRDSINAEASAIIAELEIIAEKEQKAAEMEYWAELDVDVARFNFDALLGQWQSSPITFETDQPEIKTEPSPPESVEVNTNCADLLIADLIQAHNDIRVSRGLDPLAANELLSEAARKHAVWMASEDFISHIGENESTAKARADAEGYLGLVVGENVAGGGFTINEVMQGFMDSKAHRDNIIEPNFTDIGASIQCQPTKAYRVFWVIKFGGS